MSEIETIRFKMYQLHNPMIPASILYKCIAGRHRPVSYPDGPITPRYTFIKNSYWGVKAFFFISLPFCINERKKIVISFFLTSPFYYVCSQPRWLNWMRRPTGDQEVAGSTPAEVGSILSWRLNMKYFLLSSSPFR